MECPGKCEESKDASHFKHSETTYKPYEDRRYDEWLCRDYWRKLGWKPPVSNEMMEKIEMCNFVCCHKSHPIEGEGMVFCTKKARHEGQHIFTCDHTGGCDPCILDVAFLCDTTGSMIRWVEKTTSTIKKII